MIFASTITSPNSQFKIHIWPERKPLFGLKVQSLPENILGLFFGQKKNSGKEIATCIDHWWWCRWWIPKSKIASTADAELLTRQIPVHNVVMHSFVALPLVITMMVMMFSMRISDDDFLEDENDYFVCCLHLLVITVRMTELRGMFSRTLAE